MTIEQMRAEAARLLREADRLESEMCSGVAASWCPVCGDCECPDPEDLNDDQCPLHSGTSPHAVAGGTNA